LLTAAPNEAPVVTKAATAEQAEQVEKKQSRNQGDHCHVIGSIEVG
jgi:hypothetical protein